MDACQIKQPEAGWIVAGAFLDALTRRDFTSLKACLSPEVHFRALVPPGPFELTGADETVERFRTWFGEHEVFEVLDAAIGQIGPRVYLRWRLNTSRGVVEQHAFATGGDRIDSIDLMCSGFQAI